MDCNKDEALRAKEIALEKMRTEDFEGAKKLALKAQNLHPELDKIAQILTTCTVHCSAKKKILGSETDPYGVLQLEKLSDGPAVRRQYRKLALVLHPDKNGFPGAEGAFKLICEANALLSDPEKKHEYDGRIKAMLQVQANRFANRAQARVPNGASRSQPPARSSSSSAVGAETFRTVCPSCKTRYQCLRRFVDGGPLWCQKCKNTFMGCEEMAANGGASVGANGGRASEQREPPKPEANQATDSKRNVEKASGNNEGIGGTNPTNAGGDYSSEAKGDKDLKNVDKGTPANNQTDESIQAHDARRSSRKRGHASYNGEDDGDFDTPAKRSRHAGPGNGEEEQKEDAPKSKNSEAETVEVTENEAPGGEKLDFADGPVEISSDFSLTTDDDAAADDDVSHCPDPEFSDFDRERERGRFKAGQFWACYDSFDGMPRFYARVKNVHDSPFQLTFAWLEADPVDERQMKWAEEELPVGCGRFKLGQTEKTSSLPTFSHQINCEKGKKRNTFVVYPREGEIWAIFKDWDMTWRLEPEKHRQLKYEVVEVLADFDEGSGAEVIRMCKVEGFVSLFQRAAAAAARGGAWIIEPREIYRFSHRILCSKMIGTEREGVPPGSYELDPASLPLNPEHLHCPCKAVVAENLDTDSEEVRSSPRGEKAK